MKTISIIVPVYKVEAYLRSCVDSILAQTYSDFELILVDDGSPDNCGAICDEYAAKDKRVYVIHQQNSGLSAARNAGIDWVFAHSDSEWLTFIDSDDLVCDSFLEQMIKLVQIFNSDIAVCQMVEFEEDADVFHTDLHDNTKVFSGQEAAKVQYDQNHTIIRVSAWGKLYHKFLFHHLRFPVGKIHEDQAVVPIALFNAEYVVATSQQLYGYRLREQSIMHSRFSAKRYDDITAVDQCISYFQQHNAQDLVAAAQRRRSELICIYSLIARKQGVYSEVPKQYRISEHNALKWLRLNLSDEKYTYQLAKIHPERILPHEYWRKIKMILHIPCK